MPSTLARIIAVVGIGGQPASEGANGLGPGVAQGRRRRSAALGASSRWPG